MCVNKHECLSVALCVYVCVCVCACARAHFVRTRICTLMCVFVLDSSSAMQFVPSLQVPEKFMEI